MKSAGSVDEHKYRCSDCGKIVYRTSLRCHSCQNKALAKQREYPRGAESPTWKGGRVERPGHGYVRVKLPGHPGADKQGYVFEHRLIMEAYLGRVLLPTEIVHHINGIVDDNRIGNLALFPSNGDHVSFHGKKRHEKK